MERKWSGLEMEGEKGRCKIRDAQVETRRALKALILLRFPLSIFYFLGTFNHWFGLVKKGTGSKKW